LLKLKAEGNIDLTYENFALPIQDVVVAAAVIEFHLGNERELNATGY